MIVRLDVGSPPARQERPVAGVGQHRVVAGRNSPPWSTVVSAASRADITRTIVDGEVVYDPDEGVDGVTPADYEAMADASAALWDRL